MAGNDGGRMGSGHADVIGKYVRHMVAPHLGLASEEAKAGKLSVEFLRENGFF